jgi:hypothetical protein
MYRLHKPEAGTSSKKAKTGEDSSSPCGPPTERLDPLSFVTWNASLKEEKDKQTFIANVSTHDLDFIALQETWLPAAGPSE